MALTQVIPELDGDVDRAADWPAAFNAGMRTRESLDFTSPITAATYDAEVGDHLIVVSAASNAVTVNLPPAADCAGRVVRVLVVSVAGGNVVIDAFSTETIFKVGGGATTLTISTQYDSKTLWCNGTAWYVLL